ncbi:MAG TPA: phosphoglycerate dehydrogenase [Candidatus Sulfotelmatobacter sp.]|nr:phosphoglycerate dehydrogenase [Candidatus Sulfotelmatobacter sp.]
MKALLLENISGVAALRLASAGFEVETAAAALSGELLRQKLRGASVLGIRSKTRISADVLEAADSLLAIGAFCIGVDQIDRAECSRRGIAVFNDPHSNSRSVAEMALGQIIMLMRRIFAANAEMHAGLWNKTASGSHEVRGLVLGIVGYGRIGSQLSDLAEALGLRVIFTDVADVLARGNAKRCSFEEVLRQADVVSLHVDGKPRNRNLFGEEEFRLLKPGACFLNLSRGFVVDHEALARHLKNGTISGAAIDVFPNEPESHGPFSSPLQGLPNVILTPHIGGSTEEAQQNIGQFVSSRLVEYLETGNSMLSVNLPHCQLEHAPASQRLTHIHQNVPGMLFAINHVLAKRGINIERQVLDTRGEIGYAIYDINRGCDAELIAALGQIPHTIRVRATNGGT